jgi:hypothetical protein
MKWGKCRWGSLKVGGKTFTKDVILDRGVLRKRKKKPSRSEPPWPTLGCSQRSSGVRT